MDQCKNLFSLPKEIEEQSKAHLKAVSDYISWNHNNVEDFFAKQLSISKAEIQRKRYFLSRVIDVLKLIGKLGLPYRGTRGHEVAHTLDDQTMACCWNWCSFSQNMIISPRIMSKRVLGKVKTRMKNGRKKEKEDLGEVRSFLDRNSYYFILLKLELFIFNFFYQILSKPIDV